MASLFTDQEGSTEVLVEYEWLCSGTSGFSLCKSLTHWVEQQYRILTALRKPSNAVQRSDYMSEINRTRSSRLIQAINGNCSRDGRGQQTRYVLPGKSYVGEIRTKTTTHTWDRKRTCDTIPNRISLPGDRAGEVLEHSERKSGLLLWELGAIGMASVYRMSTYANDRWSSKLQQFVWGIWWRRCPSQVTIDL